MQTIKEIFNFLDFTLITFWGFNTIEVLGYISTNGFAASLSTVDNVIKVLFALAGFVFFLIKIHHFYHKSKLERAKLKEEVEKLENENIKIWTKTKN